MKNIIIALIMILSMVVSIAFMGIDNFAAGVFGFLFFFCIFLLWDDLNPHNI